MYSVVLATMLTAGSATPAWHHHYCHGCHSCYSCYSGYGCYSGYSGYSGYGCCSCYSCYSCSSCYSCYSCYNGCHRPLFNHCHSYCNCSGYVYNSCCSCNGAVAIACCGGGAPQVVPVPSDPKKPADLKKPKSTAESSAPAKVVVALPSDAKLWVDNVPCPLTSAVRSFDTPALATNQEYFYNLKVEIVRDGRTVSETQRIILRPGQESRVDFNTSAVIGTASR